MGDPAQSHWVRNVSAAGADGLPVQRAGFIAGHMDHIGGLLWPTILLCFLFCCACGCTCLLMVQSRRKYQQLMPPRQTTRYIVGCSGRYRGDSIAVVTSLYLSRSEKPEDTCVDLAIFDSEDDACCAIMQLGGDTSVLGSSARQPVHMLRHVHWSEVGQLLVSVEPPPWEDLLDEDQPAILAKGGGGCGGGGGRGGGGGGGGDGGGGEGVPVDIDTWRARLEQAAQQSCRRSGSSSSMDCVQGTIPLSAHSAHFSSPRHPPSISDRPTILSNVRSSAHLPSAQLSSERRPHTCYNTDRNWSYSAGRTPGDHHL